MWYIDGHCDVLWKMYEQGESMSFYDPDSPLDVSHSKVIQSDYLMQTFAVFVPPEIPMNQRLSACLGMIDQFYRRVVGNEKKVKPILCYEDIMQAQQHNQLGALLHLEGAESLQGELHHLRILQKLGVRSIGLTWNEANEVADGAEEPRGGGLTRFGRVLVAEMKKLHMLLDVSHLSVRGFWDVMEETDHIAIYASHSNTRHICEHRRNLDDEQIKAILDRDGIVGLTFVPWFLDPNWCFDVNIGDPRYVLKHLDHICSLGGEKQVGFGSDFDGFSPKIHPLHNATYIDYLANLLLRHYKETQVAGFLYTNWLSFYQKYLP